MSQVRAEEVTVIDVAPGPHLSGLAIFLGPNMLAMLTQHHEENHHVFVNILPAPTEAGEQNGPAHGAMMENKFPCNFLADRTEEMFELMQYVFSIAVKEFGWDAELKRRAGLPSDSKVVTKGFLAHPPKERLN